MNEMFVALSEIETAEIEKKTGYVFKDKRLLSKAFSHSSLTNENKNAVSNERLEFLGDRILNFIVAKELFFNEKGDEGKLTNLLKSKVSRLPLSESIKALDVLKFLKTSQGSKIESFENKAVSDLYEAIIGAIFIDSGDLSACEEFVKSSLKYAEEKDYITLLKEHCEKNKIELSKDSFAQGSNFCFKIVVSGKEFTSVAKTKKDAERDCSHTACTELKID